MEEVTNMGRGKFGQFRGLSCHNFLESRYNSICFIFGTLWLGEVIDTPTSHITDNTLHKKITHSRTHKCQIVLTIAFDWLDLVYCQQHITHYISRITHPAFQHTKVILSFRVKIRYSKILCDPKSQNITRTKNFRRLTFIKFFL